MARNASGKAWQGTIIFTWLCSWITAHLNFGQFHMSDNGVNRDLTGIAVPIGSQDRSIA